MPDPDAHPASQDPARPAPARRRSLLAGMRIRKKLVFLHTLFMLVLTAILVGMLRPAVSGVVREAEWAEADVLLAQADARIARAVREGRAPEGAIATLAAELPAGITLRLATRGERADPALAGATLGAPLRLPSGASGVSVEHGGEAFGVVAGARLDGARAGVARLYLILTLALLTMYALVVVSLEVFVLPKHVYGPIRSLLRADRSVQEGRRERELIDEQDMPADELGEIMRSRNRSIVTIRRHERDLAAALAQLEQVATDLKRKNHLLEMAKRNLADADRLASLGMMSAGIAHELNTPLAVLKGLVEKLDRDPARGVSQSEASLMLRVVKRLERLSESLLDFARVRPPETRPALLAPLVEEAWTLVRLDREARAIDFATDIDPATVVHWDADRMMQVFVNLLRNAVDAMEGRGSIRVGDERFVREGQAWISVTIEDDGPGLTPELMSRLFEPFVSTRLDARGTGLGLAVAEGIVREHGGLLLARNREAPALTGEGGEPTSRPEREGGGGGAVFEIMLPVHAPEHPTAQVEGAQPARGSPEAHGLDSSQTDAGRPGPTPHA